jgi:hypothetical protein
MMMVVAKYGQRRSNSSIIKIADVSRGLAEHSSAPGMPYFAALAVFSDGARVYKNLLREMSLTY